MSKLNVKALLLAAGYGKRLKPLTDTGPKCLMPIKGYPLMAYWLETLKNANVQKVLVNLHCFPDIVADFLKQPVYSDFTEFFFEENLQGTLGSLLNNYTEFKGYNTLLIHADNLCRCNFQEFINFHLHKRPKETLLTMMTFDSDNPTTCGIIKKDNKGIVIDFFEKVSEPPGIEANGAVYILSPELIELLKKDFCWATDFSNQVIPNFLEKIATWKNKDHHRDIGNIKSLVEAQKDQFTPLTSHFPGKSWQEYFHKQPIFNNNLIK